MSRYLELLGGFAALGGAALMLVLIAVAGQALVEAVRLASTRGLSRDDRGGVGLAVAIVLAALAGLALLLPVVVLGLGGWP